MPPYLLTQLIGGFLGGVTALTVVRADGVRTAFDRLLCAMITAAAATWITSHGITRCWPSVEDGAELRFFVAVVIGAHAWFVWHWFLNFASRRTGKEWFEVAAEVLKKVGKLIALLKGQKK